MAPNTERSEVDRSEVERSEVPSSRRVSRVQQSRATVNPGRVRIELGQAHKSTDVQGSFAYLTRSLDDSCGKRRRARPAKKRHQHSTRSDQSERGISPYGTILRTKHGEESQTSLHNIKLNFSLSCSCILMNVSCAWVSIEGFGVRVMEFLWGLFGTILSMPETLQGRC